jgi:hypothetical protein
MFAYPRLHKSTADVNNTVLLDRECNLSHLLVSNGGAATAYLKLYDSETAVGTTGTAKHVIPIPATTFNMGVSLIRPLKFKSGLAIRITGALADNDATAVGANEVLVNYGID